ncbi:MAG: formylglycine-generating enzyme family protein [Steroidobacteraceae bacterium]
MHIRIPHCRLLHVATLCSALAVAVPGAQAQEFLAPLDEQLDAMRLRIESAEQAGRPLDVLAALDYYRVTTLPESRIPANDLLAEAHAAAETGDPRRALKALNGFLQKAPADDERRVAAQALLPDYQQKADVAEAAAEAERKKDDLRREQSVQQHKPPAVIMQLAEDMVRIPGGVFLMGSQSRLRADTDEKPIHTVRIKPFRLSRYEVTYEQYDLFARATRRPLPQDGGYGRGRNPVGNVSWEDAKAFIEWLRQTTGLAFRLPSESEWEYVARSGSKDDFPWGDTFDPDLANGPDVSGKDQWSGPSPVGSFRANAFGVHDMIGNVWEWVQDCYRGDYVGAPFDGSADDREGCTNRIFRGGSFYSFTKYMRTSYRAADGSTKGNITIGFRLAED